MASLHTWDAWVKSLASAYRIIRFDVPGFGLTGASKSRQYTPERMLEVTRLLLEYLKVEKATVIGNSLGGYIAWNFALAYPERVEKLVLIDPAGYPMKKVPWMIASADLPGSLVFVPIWMPRALVAQGIKQVYGDAKRIKPGVVDRYYDISRLKGNRESAMRIFRTLTHTNKTGLHTTPERVSQLKVPTLLMWGELDRWISPEHVPLWQRDVPGLQVKRYAGVGHIPMEEIPEQSLQDLLHFIKA